MKQNYIEMLKIKKYKSYQVNTNQKTSNTALFKPDNIGYKIKSIKKVEK